MDNLISKDYNFANTIY